MTRVAFGLACSMFILAATIKFHLRKYKDSNPDVYDMLNNSLYVDDLCYGADTEQNALKLSREAVQILNEGGMVLRKFKTNSKLLKNMWDKEDAIKQEETTESSIKILGLKWNNLEDTLRLDVENLINCLDNIKNTKRCVLQTASKIYDPAGYINPFVIRIKFIFQELWEKGITWDDELPEDLKVKWSLWCSEVATLKHLYINRKYFPMKFEAENDHLELHVFCDASPLAYGAVAYFRFFNEGKFQTTFIMSKSRVSPLKRLTLPRLELMSTVIGARMSSYLKQIFKIQDNKVYLWSDSTISLYWIKGSARQWKPFVANRVTDIQAMTDPECWRYCKGKDNPADIITRGEAAKSLITNHKWWHGAPFLEKPFEEWPPPLPKKINEDDMPEKRKPKTLVCTITSDNKKSTNDPLLDIAKYSSLTRLTKLTAWILRFTWNAKSTEKRSGMLTVEELLNAERFWIQQTQGEAFPTELATLQQKKSIDKGSPIYNLNTFLDEFGIIRIGGRLQKSTLTFQEKHPVLLPSKHKFTELVIQQAHALMLHMGVASTLSHIRERFWINRGRQSVKQVLNKCTVCKRYNSRPGKQIMAPLPANRLEESPPFYICGLDFAGPVFIRGSDVKYYILLLTCAVTRAVHLELVGNLSSETFLLAFRRFASRRGMCSVIYSDNALTFKRANRDLSTIWKIISHPDVKQFYASKGIKWNFIVERSPWWGGMWERMVRSVKLCLRKTVGKTSLKAEELETVLVEIEAVINSRPITYVYSEHEEPSPLTPAHFLVGKRLMAIPPVKINIATFPNTRPVLIKRYNYRERLMNQFWKRFQKEYLLNLKTANSVTNCKISDNFKVNDIVLVSDERLPRNMWKLGKIVETFVGRDGQIRSCSVKTANATIKRSIQLLHKLEV